MHVHTDNLNETSPLYMKYPDKFLPEPAYVELDCREDGTLSAEWFPRHSGFPAYYFNKLAVRWYVDAETEGAVIQEMFSTADFLACCQRILNGVDELWDGRNIVGTYSDDANKAIDDAEAIISSLMLIAQKPGTRKRASAIRRRPSRVANW